MSDFKGKDGSLRCAGFTRLGVAGGRSSVAETPPAWALRGHKTSTAVRISAPYLVAVKQLQEAGGDKRRDGRLEVIGQSGGAGESEAHEATVRQSELLTVYMKRMKNLHV